MEVPFLTHNGLNKWRGFIASILIYLLYYFGGNMKVKKNDPVEYMHDGKWIEPNWNNLYELDHINNLPQGEVRVKGCPAPRPATPKGLSLHG